jgi:flavin reductase (DIM6/NTAB) family NADH-FMN oxidoreductase RutF
MESDPFSLTSELELLDPDAFRSVLGRFASGVTVLTTRHGESDLGMTVSAFCSLSLNPALVLSCINKTADLHHLLPRGQRVVFNILSSSQEALALRRKPIERFDGVGMRRSPRHRCQTTCLLDRGSIVEQHDGGD